MAKICDLELDVLRFIMVLLVQSSDGAADLARAISVCKDFKKFEEDENILRTVNFDNVRLSTFHMQINGLVHKCAQAGNLAAQFLLSKVILLSTSQLPAPEVTSASYVSTSDGPAVPRWRIFGFHAPMGSFINHFLLDNEASTSDSSRKQLVHYQLIKTFLHQCRHYDITEMGDHLSGYIMYFFGSDDQKCLDLHEAINKMRGVAAQIGLLIEWVEIKGNLDGSMTALTGFRRAVMNDCFVDRSRRSPRQNELMDAYTTCSTTVMRLALDFANVNVDYAVLFGHELSAETFGAHFEEVGSLFEEYRARALSAFEHCFP